VLWLDNIEHIHIITPLSTWITDCTTTHDFCEYLIILYKILETMSNKLCFDKVALKIRQSLDLEPWITSRLQYWVWCTEYHHSPYIYLYVLSQQPIIFSYSVRQAKMSNQQYTQYTSWCHYDDHIANPKSESRAGWH
jgi:hypothetical protein